MEHTETVFNKANAKVIILALLFCITAVACCLILRPYSYEISGGLVLDKGTGTVLSLDGKTYQLDDGVYKIKGGM